MPRIDSSSLVHKSSRLNPLLLVGTSGIVAFTGIALVLFSYAATPAAERPVVEAPVTDAQLAAERVAPPQPATADAMGLTGIYYDNADFTGAKIRRIDPKIDFGWGQQTPTGVIDPESFSVRWTGNVVAPVAGEYTFFTQADDRVRLWVNGRRLISAETSLLGLLGSEARSEAVQLEAGQAYNITIDYAEVSGAARMRLLWEGPGIGKQVVQPDRLRP